jgi:arylsulfatase A-like enzyme
VVLVTLLSTLTVARADDRPNFLFLYSDDQRADTIAAWGNEHIDTPVLDGLVARGYSFKRNYCMGSMHGAVCVPSRAMIMTGQAYFRIPMDLEGVDTLPQRLGEAGYTTFVSGKWHNKERGILKSFQNGRAIMMGGMSNHLDVPLVDIVPGSDTGKKRLGNRRQGDGFSTEMFTDEAVKFLTEYDGDAPFYCYVPFTAPHDPRMPPQPYRDKYYADRPPLPPNFLTQHPFDNGALTTRDENLAPWPRTEDVIRDQLAEYYGMIEHLDAQIGRLLKALERTEYADNTYIFFASDHGLAMGSHGLLGKQSIYEHSMRSPMIVTGPTVPHGETQALTYLFDTVPTIVELSGIEALNPMDGSSLAPLWRGDRASLRDVIFLSYDNTQRAVVEPQWKLIRYPRIDLTQLFDLADDPFEMRNLAEVPEYADRVDALMETLAREQERYGDTAPLEVEHPNPKYIDLTGVRGAPDPWQPEWIIDKYFVGAPPRDPR